MMIKENRCKTGKIKTGDLLVLLCAILLLAIPACSKNEENQNGKDGENPASKQSSVELFNEPFEELSDEAISLETSPDTIISVNGNELKKSELQDKIRRKMNLRRVSNSADDRLKAQKDLANQLVDNFITRVVFSDEADRLGLKATPGEIEREYAKIRAELPSRKSIDDYFKENDISKNDIVLEIQIRKLVALERTNDPKPADEEIEQFYEEHQDRFTVGETVHVRHILLAINPGDDDSTREAKRKKIEDIRSRLMDGEDFARMAAQYSDCPSKENGGDLGVIKRGQTVQPFENAVFSQDVMAIGSVVSTQHGHHILQVLKRYPTKTLKLEEVRDRIADYLFQQQEMETFSVLNERLRKKAVIVKYKNP